MNLPPSVVEVEVTLNEVEPAVTRCMDVPLSLNLDRLHAAFQIILGWSNCHLYEFEVADKRYGIPDEDAGVDVLDARATTLQDVVEGLQVTSFTYLYDFGDGWQHSVKLGRIQQGSRQIVYPFVYKAEGRCPPEDVGGPHAYGEFRKALADKKHPRHQEFVRWHGSKTFDANMVDEATMDDELRKLKSRWTRQDRVKTSS